MSFILILLRRLTDQSCYFTANAEELWIFWKIIEVYKFVSVTKITKG